MHAPMTHLRPNDDCIILKFAQLKEGDRFEPMGSGKIFTKWAGLLVAPDMEACEWIKANVGTDFFNKYVIRALHASSDRFSRKICLRNP
jgi:hypothetical protein